MAPRLATEKQLRFASKLLAEKVVDPEEKLFLSETLDDLTVQEASRLIDRLLALPRPQAPELAALEIGVYTLPDGTIVKVQPNKAKTRVYAKRWIEISGERLRDADETRVRGEWEYAPGLIHQVKPEYQMTLEQAKDFILRYGQCARCARRLKAAESVERGIGPVCVKYFSFREGAAA